MNQNIDPLFTFFNENPIFNLISFSLGIVGVTLTIYYYIKSKKNKIPTYIVRTINLVKEKIQKIDVIEIIYSGNKVSNLSMTKIALWNDGKDTISMSDIAQNNKLRFAINDGFEILDYKILFHKNPSNDFTLELASDKKSITILFDFFDFEEGIVVQLFHTGNTSEDIVIEGHVKSVKKITRKEYNSSILPNRFSSITKPRKTVNKRKIRKIIGWTILFIGVITTILGVKLFLKHEIKPEPEEAPMILKIIIFLPSILYAWTGYRILRKHIPKGFDIFNEEF